MKTNTRIFWAATCAVVLSFQAGCRNSDAKKQSAEVASPVETAVDTVKTGDDRGYIVKVGQQVPVFDLLLTDGTKIPVNSLKGKVVMLQFTASWCGVCRKEMPFIEKDIWLKWKDDPHFALYGIDLKEDAEKVREFVASISVTYPVTLDPEGAVFNLFCLPNAGVTRNIILDKTGKIVMLTRLYDPQEFDRMVEVIHSELAKN